MRRQVAVVVTLFLVVLAGCSAPLAGSDVTTPDDGETQVPTAGEVSEQGRATATSTPVPSTPEPRPAKVDVSGQLPVDSGQVFARVRQLLAAWASPPTVEVESVPSAGRGYDLGDEDRFERVWGIGPPEPSADSDLQVAGATFPSGDVYLFPQDGQPPEIERTLAHEFTHTVQFAEGAREMVADQIPADRRRTADGRLVERSVLEGAAVYSATAYGRLYQSGYPTERTQIDGLYDDASPGTQLYWSAYYHGDRHMVSRIDHPRNLTQVYRNPPTTTEQLLHNTTDDVATLRVDALDDGAPWTLTERDSRGELFLRITMRTELAPELAERAAAGWGNDRVLTFAGQTGQSWVWVVKFDDAENASEFERLAGRYLDSRASQTGDEWRNELASYDLTRVDDRTVALVAGAAPFVSGATVREDSGRVVVRPSKPEK